jgi:hypothetical protein
VYAGGWFGLGLRLLLRLRTELGGEADESFGRWGEALAGAGGGGFELRGREDAQGAGVAGGEVLLDSLLTGGGKFSVGVGA